MANPPPVAKQRGKGCCGCGCGLLVVLALLLLGLVAGVSYLGYSNGLKFTSTTPGNIPVFDGGDEVYGTANQKLKGFNHDVQNHLPATVTLSGDEINTMIARDQDFTKANVHLYVTLNADQARLQISLPTGTITDGLIKGRFLTADISFGVNFDSDSKNLKLDLRSLQIGDIDAPKERLPLIQTELNPALNQLMRNDPNFKNLLDQAKSIEIKNGQLIITTQ